MTLLHWVSWSGCFEGTCHLPLPVVQGLSFFELLEDEGDMFVRNVREHIIQCTVSCHRKDRILRSTTVCINFALLDHFPLTYIFSFPLHIINRFPGNRKYSRQHRNCSLITCSIKVVSTYYTNWQQRCNVSTLWISARLIFGMVNFELCSSCFNQWVAHASQYCVTTITKHSINALKTTGWSFIVLLLFFP